MYLNENMFLNIARSLDTTRVGTDDFFTSDSLHQNAAGTFVTWFYLIQLLAQKYQAFARRGVRGAFKKYLKWIVKNPHTFNLSSLGIYLDEVVQGIAIGL